MDDLIERPCPTGFGVGIVLPEDGVPATLLIGLTGKGVYSEPIGEGPVSIVVAGACKWVIKNPVPVIIGLLLILTIIYFNRV